VDWVIGSGTHANGYLVNIDDHLSVASCLLQEPPRLRSSAGFEHQTDPISRARFDRSAFSAIRGLPFLCPEL